VKSSNLFFKIILWCQVLTASIFLQSGLVSAQEKPKLLPLELNRTTWAVDIVYVDQSGAKDTQQDTLVFEDGQFYSESFKKKGYEPTNYSVTVTEDDATNFGTMQNMEEESAFWDGRVVGEVIGGSLHVLSNNGKNKKEYYFKGKLASGVLERKDPTAKPKAVESVPAVQLPVNAVVPESAVLPTEGDQTVPARVTEKGFEKIEQDIIPPSMPALSIEPRVTSETIKAVDEKVNNEKALDEVSPKKKKKGWFQRKTE
jgi:hypothetical protein